MKRTIITIISFIILIGVIGLSMNVALGNHTVMYLDRVRNETSGIYMYKFNTWDYIENLKISVGTISKLSLALPTRQWEWMTSIFNWEPLGNDLALILDYMIFILNILIYPLRIGAYLLRNILALVGINVTDSYKNGLWWLAQLTEWLINRIQIPYI